MFNDDDRQLSTPNYNNINSFFYSSTKYHHTINGTNNNMKERIKRDILISVEIHIDYFMALSISALVSFRESHISPMR